MIEEQINRILQESKMKLTYEIAFPFEDLPPEVKLALEVLMARGMKIRIVIKPIENLP